MQPSAVVRGVVCSFSVFVSLSTLVGCGSIWHEEERPALVVAEEESQPLLLEYDPTSGMTSGGDVDAGTGTFDAMEVERRPDRPVVEVKLANEAGDHGGASDVVSVRRSPGSSAPDPEAGIGERAESGLGGTDPVEARLSPDELLELRSTALGRLGVLIERQRPLDDLERASMQDYIIQLVALHDLDVGNSRDYRDVLIKAADRLVQPSRRVRFRLAAFFEDIGISDRADKLWPTAGSPTKTTDDAREERGVLAISSVEPTTIFRSGKSRDFDLEDLQPGDELIMLATLDGLTAKSVVGGYRYKYSVIAFIYDENDEYLEHQPIEKNKTELSPRPLDPPVVSIRYEIPTRYQSGNYRLELKITDELSSEQDYESVALRIRRRSTR